MDNAIKLMGDYVEKYKNAHNESINPIYMLSEFLDNSLMYKVKDKVTCSIWFTNEKLEYRDDSMGIKKSEVQDKLFSSKPERNGLSKFHVGMKEAMFWFGTDVKILSKTINDDEYYLNLDLYDEMNEDRNFKFIKPKNELKETGLGFNIRLLNNIISYFGNSETTKEMLIKALTEKYYFAIKKGEMEIKIKIIEDEPYTIDQDSVEINSITFEDFEGVKELMEMVPTDWKQRVDMYLEEKGELNAVKSEEVVCNVTNLRVCDVYNNVVNLKEMKFNIECYEDFYYENGIPLSVGILKKVKGSSLLCKYPQNYNEYKGLNLHQDGRGITIGPMKKIRKVPVLNKIQIFQGRTSARFERIAGIAELKPNVAIDQNKKAFTGNVEKQVNNVTRLVHKLRLSDWAHWIMELENLRKPTEEIINKEKFKKNKEKNSVTTKFMEKKNATIQSNIINFSKEGNEHKFELENKDNGELFKIIVELAPSSPKIISLEGFRTDENGLKAIVNYSAKHFDQDGMKTEEAAISFGLTNALLMYELKTKGHSEEYIKIFENAFDKVFK